MRGKTVILLLACLVFLFGSVRARPVSAHPATDTAMDPAGCQPGTVWRWTPGPLHPEIAASVARDLAQSGVRASVEASGYGESDDCGVYHNSGMDFNIQIAEDKSRASTQSTFSTDLLAVLKRNAGTGLGNVLVTYPGGAVKNLAVQPALGYQTSADNPSAIGSFNRKVYVIIYNPLLHNGQTLIDYRHWSDPNTLTQGTIDFFRNASHGLLQYQVAATTVVNDEWPEKIDGFRYTEAEYLAVLNHQASPHTPDEANYTKIVNSTRFDICGRANRGEIDEVWIYNAPFMGFYESTLVGPGAYFYNSYPVPGPWTCNRLIPIMGPSAERGLSEAMENFGHRSESTMAQTYHGWQQNSTSHNWNRFALVKALSPNYSYSGCGSVHYPPNGVRDYDWSNSTAAQSNCTDFDAYPNLASPPVLRSVGCSTWGCSSLGYFQYWFSHYPHGPGCGYDEAANQWWDYLAMPALANNPLGACVLAAPTGLRATAVSASQINLTWQDNSADESGFQVQQSADGSSGWTQLTLTAAGATSYSHTGLPDGAKVYYRVRAYRSVDNFYSSPTGIASATTWLLPLTAPTNLRAAAVSCTRASLTWTDPSASETNFRVERVIHGGSGWAEIATLATNSTSYINQGLSLGTTYDYRVRVYRSADNSFSPYSAVATVSTPACTGVVLAAKPALAQVSLDQDFDVSLEVQAGPQMVNRAAAYLNFNPAYLRVVAVRAGSALPTVLTNSYDNTAGRLNYVASISTGSLTGTFSLATVTFHALAATSGAVISFGTVQPRKSDVTFGGESALSSLESGTVAVLTASLEGSVTLQGRAAPPAPEWSVPLEVSLTVPGARQPAYTFSPTTTTSGKFTLSPITPGTYQVRVKHSSSLSNFRTVTLAAGSNMVDFGMLLEGDANQDNRVTSADLTVLDGSYARCKGTAGYAALADFNEDGCVSLLDFSMLAADYGRDGDIPITGSTATLDSDPAAVLADPVVIQIDPAHREASTGSIFTVSILVQAGTQPLDGAQASLSFDPALVRVKSVSGNTDRLSHLLQSAVDNSDGRVDFAAGTLADFPTGAVELARIEFEAIGPQSTTPLAFQFAAPRGTNVTGGGRSILTSSQDGKIWIAYQVFLPILLK